VTVPRFLLQPPFRCFFRKPLLHDPTERVGHQNVHGAKLRSGAGFLPIDVCITSRLQDTALGCREES
jgi:hypothetical protein